jgi:hypothetical protein
MEIGLFLSIGTEGGVPLLVFNHPRTPFSIVLVSLTFEDFNTYL